MKLVLKTTAFLCFLGMFLGVDLVGEIAPKVLFVKEAQALIGRPLTPLSYAGVARRTTRRTVAAGTAVAATSAATAAAAAAATPPPTTAPVPPPPSPSVSGVPIGTVVQALPAGCTSVVVGGANYSECNGAFYKAAFEGNNLVYVVVQNPLQ